MTDRLTLRMRRYYSSRSRAQKRLIEGLVGVSFLGVLMMYCAVDTVLGTYLGIVRKACPIMTDDQVLGTFVRT